MTEELYFWGVVTMLALGTLTIRGSIIAMSSKIVITEKTKEVFSFIPAAILPAFIAPSIFYHQGQLVEIWNNERLLVIILATVIFLATRSTLACIGFGLSLLYILT